MYLKLKELIKKSDLTGKEIAEKIGISITAMSSIVNEKSTPSLETYKKIADLLGVGLSDLFEDKNDTHPSPVHGFLKVGDSIREVSSINDLIDATKDATDLLTKSK